MKTKMHDYTATIEWTGNTGEGTRTYKSYDRDWSIITPDKSEVICSNDPVLGGDPTKHNPEDLLVASVASCHMLWYLHLCSSAGITVLSYRDSPLGRGEMQPSGAGRFVSITLKPQITVTADSDVERAKTIHGEIHQYCFIARSLNFPVTIEPQITRS